MSSYLSSLDDKGETKGVSSMGLLASSWKKVQITMRCFRVSSDLPSLVDKGETKRVSINGLVFLWLTKGADNHEVSSRVIGLAVSG